MCKFTPEAPDGRREDASFQTPLDVLHHLWEHERAGHKVPKRGRARVLDDVLRAHELEQRKERRRK